jgi:hypothetical protein
MRATHGARAVGITLDNISPGSLEWSDGVLLSIDDRPISHGDLQKKKPPKGLWFIEPAW